MRVPGSRAERPARILIVDDEPLNVDYLEQELESLGFDTETAANGLEALDRVAAAQPDLVLLDVMMPEMDGITALRIIKNDPETRLIPVVLMTALNAVEDRVRGIEAGADDFLSKPVDDRELLARIKTTLALKRAIDETVGELRSSSDQLERYGRQERDVAVLAVAWTLRDEALPGEAVDFVGRSHRASAEERIRAYGGTMDESDADVLVAVFDGPDPRTRAIAAVEAALAVVEGSTPAGAAQVTVSAAVSAGAAQVGSTRVQAGGEWRWTYGAEGEPVDRASELARAAAEGGVLVAGEAGADVSDRFRLEPSNGAYRVLGTSADESHPGTRRGDRHVMTFLLTDIVDSTRTVERIGDRAWAELVGAHERAIREELVLFGGEEVDTTGDGFLATFDSPERAIRCALAVRDRAAELGLTIRAGIHTGEVERAAGKVRGIAVHLASRIAGRANAAEVLVSATTRELAAGSDLIFVDRGKHALKGVTERRRLYAAVEDPGRRSSAAPGPGSEGGEPEYPAGLTGREVDVLRLVAVGLSDAEAAKRLFLSVRTVNAHLRSIYRKAGVRSRAAAGRFAAERGLL
jgi:DNA-binding NarL/FixJ family response regulator